MRETGFTDRQLEQLVALLAPIKQDMIEVKKDIAEIKTLPTIAKELKDKNK